MPKAKGLKPQLAQAEAEFIREAPVPLTLEDRTALRTMFQSQAFKRAWAMAKLSEPTAFPGGDLAGPTGEKIAVNRLHEMRGWKLFEVALMSQINEPKPKVSRAEESWPDTGLDIVDPNKLPKAPPPAPLPLFQKPSAKT